jgi:predicted rRNA methylase YqxC with S4 and FtsJ domains
VAVYDDVRGWNTEPYLGQGEFYLDYGDFTLSVTVPAGYIVAATGSLDNAKDVLTPAQIDRPATWVVCDASFIALRKVLEVPLALAARPTRLVALIKPQFEVGRGEVGKGGVVRDAALHRRVCEEVQDWLESEGWAVQGIAQSPITGPEGNIEFLISAMRHEYVPDVA